jgi:hypothetical protein
MGSMVLLLVADGLLALGREVKEGGSDEVGSLEDLKVPLGVVVAFGAVDDGLAGGVPGDFHIKKVKPEARSPQRRKDWMVATAEAGSGPRDLRWCFW